MASTGGGPNLEELMQMALQAAKRGQKQGARVMLRKILTENKRHEGAMMLMARLANDNKEQRKWLERALKVNGENESARLQLQKMEHDEKAERNRTLLMIGVGAWVVFVVISAIILLTILI